MALPWTLFRLKLFLPVLGAEVAGGSTAVSGRFVVSLCSNQVQLGAEEEMG